MLILVAEDDPLSAMMLKDILLSGGHEVLGPAPTVDDALYISARRPPLLALLDINLRDGLVGPSLARRLLKGWGIRAIFVTASLHDALANQDAALGLIEKPFTTSVILESVAYAEAFLSGATSPFGQTPQGLRLFPCDNGHESPA